MNRVMRLSIFCWLLAYSPVPAIACEIDESFLFTCQTENPARTISLCGQQEDTGEGMRWLGLHYVYETEKGIELSYPPEPTDSFKDFFFSHDFHNGQYEASLRFAVGADSYRIYYRDAPEGAESQGGVEVSRAEKPVETIRCGDKPSWYFEETRLVTACDMENPLGERACLHDPPELK